MVTAFTWLFLAPDSVESEPSILVSVPCFTTVFHRTVVDKTCPVCREALKSTDDTWVISEAPDSDQVNEEIRRTLIGLAGNEAHGSM